MKLDDFPRIYTFDFEFTQRRGEIPKVICLTARELRTGRWIEQFEPTAPAYRIDDGSLFVGYAPSADLGCHLALGWPLPRNVIDLFAEFRLLTNTMDRDNRYASSLLAAAAYFKIPHIESETKDKIRVLAMRGSPYTEEEKRSLLDYNRSDAAVLAPLLERLVGHYRPARFDQALLRGRYACAVACAERAGIPIDVETLARLRDRWESIRLALIQEVDKDFHIYRDTHFKFDLFEDWLKRRRITWPRTRTGRLASDDDTFRAMVLAHPILQPLKELRATLSSLKLESLAVGHDGRNRTQLKSFQTVTGRNAPSNSEFCFGPATWIRNLIKPEPGKALAYVDYEQQEFGVAASLSGDRNMQAAYASGDPYLKFAKQAGAVPQDASKQTHGAIRELYKMVVLAVQYGMGEKSLSGRIGKSESEAAGLIRQHQQTYSRFWQWKERILAHVQLERSYSTPSGWRVIQRGKLDEHQRRSLVNFPVQATAADVFRLACCLGAEAGIKICAPVHDAVLIECPLDELQDQVSLMQSLMEDASRQVLDGFTIRTDVKIFRDRFSDPRGLGTWRLINDLLARPMPAPKQFGFFEAEERGVPSVAGSH